jgi:hypothetical protein
MSALSVICLLALIIILARVIHVAAHLNVRRYSGHWLRFAALGAHWALLTSGAVAVTIGLPLGGQMLLIALALLLIADRRRI